VTGPGNGVLPVGEDDLHAYVDGQLSPDRREAVERWLAGAAEAASRAAFYARLNADLHRRYDHVLGEPIPASMTPAYGERRRGRDRRAPSLKQFAIAASWLIAGIVAGWSTHDLLIPPKVIERVVEVPAPGPTLTLQAAAAHAVYTPEVRHPVEVRADEAHLVRWLSNRMGKPIKAPVLDDSGWRLMGGRLLPVTDTSGPVACQFMYENADGNRVTLYMKSMDAAEASSFRYSAERDGVGVLYWMDTKLAYAMTGKLPKEDLKALARKVYDQFNS
jgi:anti-sigma factor RsiW